MGELLIRREDLRRVVVAVDPAVTASEEADDTGILVVARGPHQAETCALERLAGRCPGHAYVLDDRTCHVAPHEWARRAVVAYEEWDADRLVAEVNNGGDMVGETVRAVRAGIPYEQVRATRGKRRRAEPVAALWEQGRGHLVGIFPELEAQLTTWLPESDHRPGVAMHDDRLDALVWGVSALGLSGGQGGAFLQLWRAEIEAQRDAPAAAPPPELVGLPTFEGWSVTPPRAGCAHYYFDGICTRCGGHRPRPVLLTPV